MIFLIDDDIDDQELFIEAVHELDAEINCVCASNGEEGLAILEGLQTKLPDLIFLDLNMPRLNGKQCLVRLKTNTKLRHIPVVMYTTSSQESDAHESLKLGAVNFITKPSSFRELCEKLEDILLTLKFPIA